MPKNTKYNNFKQREKNAEIREDIEKVIMLLNNLQDDIIDEYLFLDEDIERSRNDMKELRRRFGIISSRLRILKDDFILVPHIPPYLQRDAATSRKD